MRYRIWDTEINRLFGAFVNEADALALVRTLINASGEAYANDLAVGCGRPDGTFTGPRSDAALVSDANQRAVERKDRQTVEAVG
jgi:hypothetical protein